MKKNRLLIYGLPVFIFLFLLFSVEAGADNTRGAFEMLQKIKARNFIDRCGNLAYDFRKDADQDLLKQERELQRDISNLRNNALGIPMGAHAPDMSKYPLEKLNILFNKYDNLLLRIKLTTPYPPQSKTDLPSIYDIQKILPDDSAILDYYMGRDEGYLFVLTNTSLKSVHLKVSRKDITGMVNNYIGLLKKYNNDTLFDVRSQDLARTLGVEEAVKSLPQKTRLFIAPQGILHQLPFHTLQVADQGMLIEKYRVSVIPSASAYYQMKKRTGERTQGSGGVFFALSPADENSHTPARIIPLNMKPDKSFINNGFTRENFFREAVGKEGIHIYDPYCKVNETHQDFSDLLTADSGIFNSEIANMDINAKLAVLDFPGSGLATVSAGDDMESFARCFMKAGCSNVVADLWEDQSSFDQGFWVEFYRIMSREKTDPSQAFQKAVLEMNRKKPYASWSRYVLMGID